MINYFFLPAINESTEYFCFTDIQNPHDKFFKKTIEHVSIEGGKEIMTIVESLIDKGKIEGKLEIAEKMLALKGVIIECR